MPSRKNALELKRRALKNRIKFSKKVSLIRNEVLQSQSSSLIQCNEIREFETPITLATDNRVFITIADPTNIGNTENIGSTDNDFESEEIENILNNEPIISNSLTDENRVLITFTDPIINLDNNEDIDEYYNNDDYSELEETENISNDEISNFFAVWALRHNIPHTALNEVLAFLKKNTYNFLPIDSRTLLKTPKLKSILKIEPGEYVHIGLKYGLDTIFEKFESLPNEVTLNFNIDGIPLSKSSSSCFWPILAKTNLSKKIIVVGVYHGYGQPKDFNLFMRKFVDELKELMTLYEFQSNAIKIKIGAFICDSPARAHILGIKSHAGYFGCPRCCQEGEYIGRVTFPELNSQLRTNESFRQKLDEHHHNRTSILEELDIDMVSQFVLDYMHLVLLGVTKKILKMFTSGGIESLLPFRCIEEINNMLSCVRETQPSDFQRRIQLLNQLHNYKATEFRSFLLYAGPFVLRNVVTKEKYDHFMLLNVAITLLCTPNVSDEQIEFSRELINEFINGMKLLYGAHHIVFNVHVLTHLPDDVKRFGPLDLISAFDFESYMYQLQKLLRKKHQPLSQIYNRIVEMNNIDLDEDVRAKVYPELKKPDSNGGYFEVVSKNFIVNNTLRNCWVMTDEKKILKFLYAVKRNNTVFIFAAEVIGKTDFYENPIKSSNLNVYRTSLTESTAKFWKFESIVSKLFCIEKKDSDIRENVTFDSDDEDEEYYYDNFPCRVFFPVLHSHQNI